MDLRFNTSLALGYKSASQIARLLTEDWFERNLYCPNCREISILHVEANAPVKDFVCPNCRSQYELKSRKVYSDRFQTSVADGAYCTMIKRITALDNPNFFFLHYNNNEGNNLIIVPKCFLVPEIIEIRQPLKAHAQRAGWEGCNILMRFIPSTAKIPVISNGVHRPISEVVAQYRKVYDLQIKSVKSRGWLMDTLLLVERLEREFTLNQMYAFAGELQQKHPKNNHIQDKIRQQLQFLRDKGIIEFKGKGRYRRI